MSEYIYTTDSFVINGVCDLEDIMVNRTVTEGETIVPQSGVTVNITQTPSQIVTFDIKAGAKVFIDGANAAKPIHYRTNGNTLFTGSNTAQLQTSRGWYQIGIGDGLANQSIDTTAYWTGGGRYCDSFGAFSGLWVQTARKINYTGATGTAPVIGDWVYKDADVKNQFGRVVHVSDNGDGTGFVVVRFFTGTLANLDAISIKKVIDVEGPKLTYTWNATASGADVQAETTDGVAFEDLLQEYANAIYNGLSVSSEWSGGAREFMFDHVFNTANVIFPFGIGNGAKVYAPMITLGRATAASIATNTSTTSTYISRLGDTGSAGFVLDLDGINFSDAGYYYSSVGYVTAKYCSFVNYMVQAFLEGCTVDHCIGSPRTSAGDLNLALSVGSNANITNCLVLTPFVNTDCVNFGGDANTGTLSDCIFLYGYDSVYYRFLDGINTRNYVFDNNICVVSGIFFSTSWSGCSFTNLKLYLSKNNVAVHALNNQTFTASGNRMAEAMLISNLEIVGLTQIDNTTNTSNGGFFQLYNSSNWKLRCFGMPSEPFSPNIPGETSKQLIRTGGGGGDIDIARCYTDLSYGADTYSGGAPYREALIGQLLYGDALLMSNVSTGYYNTVTPLTRTNSRVKGFEGFGDESIGTFRQVKINFGTAKGIHDSDFYYSDTLGAVLFFCCPPSPESTGTRFRVNAGSYLYDSVKLFTLNVGDILEWELDYFLRGHQSFTGKFSTISADIGDTSNSGNFFTNSLDQVTNCTFEFQYDLGTGWNGTWLDARTPANLTGISVVSGTGVKLKVKVTCNANNTNLEVFGFETNAPIAYRNADLYPIDQNETVFKIVSPTPGSRVAIHDQANLLIENVLANSAEVMSPTYVTFTIGDPVTVSYLNYGYTFKQSTPTLQLGEVLVYLSQDVNPYISEANVITVSNYTGISVDTAMKEITVDVNLSAQKIYDYMQYWQTLSANADTLLAGEIYSTYDGTTFSLLAGWTFVKTGTIGTIYIAISAIDRTGLIVPGSGDLENYTASFTSIQLFKASIYYRADLVTLQTKYIIDLHKDGSPYVIAESFNIAGGSALYSAAYHYEVRAAIGDEHKGIYGNGVRIQQNAAYSGSYIKAENYTQFNNFELDYTQVNGVFGLITGANGVVNACITHASGNAFQLIGGNGNPAVVKNCIALGNGIGVGFTVAASYSAGEVYNCVATGFSTGFKVTIPAHSGYHCKAQNNVAFGNSSNDYLLVTGNGVVTATYNASEDLSLDSITQFTSSMSGIDPLTAFVNPAANDVHLKLGSVLNNAGVDLVGVNDTDIDGEPWRSELVSNVVTPVTQSMGVDQPNGLLFSTTMKIVSLFADGYAYFIYRELDTAQVVGSGSLTVSPTYVGPEVARDLTTAVNIAYCRYGKEYNNAGFVMTPDETLLYLPHNDQINITEASSAVVAAYTFYTVDFVAKTIVISGGTQANLYDYMQYQHSLSVNAAYLPDGEVFSTVLSNVFNILVGWTLTFTAAPTGAWNMSGGTVVFNFAGGSVTGFNYSSTLFFDLAGSFTFTNSTVTALDTINHNETVGYTPAGTSNTPTNIDPTNITINVPQPTLTITGHPVGASIVIYDDNNADPQNMGTELARYDNAVASVQYVGTASNQVMITMYEPGYRVVQQSYTIAAVDATFTINPELETN